MSGETPQCSSASSCLPYLTFPAVQPHCFFAEEWSSLRLLVTVQSTLRDFCCLVGRFAAALFEGQHDFSHFCNIPKPAQRGKWNPVKLIKRFAVVDQSDGFRLEIEGTGFLWKQCRWASTGNCFSLHNVPKSLICIVCDADGSIASSLHFARSIFKCLTPMLCLLQAHGGCPVGSRAGETVPGGHPAKTGSWQGARPR